MGLVSPTRRGPVRAGIAKPGINAGIAKPGIKQKRGHTISGIILEALIITSHIHHG